MLILSIESSEQMQQPRVLFTHPQREIGIVLHTRSMNEFMATLLPVPFSFQGLQVMHPLSNGLPPSNHGRGGPKFIAVVVGIRTRAERIHMKRSASAHLRKYLHSFKAGTKTADELQKGIFCVLKAPLLAR